MVMRTVLIQKLYIRATYICCCYNFLYIHSPIFVLMLNYYCIIAELVCIIMFGSS